VLGANYAETMTPDHQLFAPNSRYRGWREMADGLGISMDDWDQESYRVDFVHKVLYYQHHAPWMDIEHELGHVLQTEYIARERAKNKDIFEESDEDEWQQPICYLGTHWYPPYFVFVQKAWTVLNPPEDVKIEELPQLPHLSTFWSEKSLQKYLEAPVECIIEADNHYLECHNYMMEFVRLSENSQLPIAALVHVACKVRIHRDSLGKAAVTEEVRKGCESLWPLSALQSTYFERLGAIERDCDKREDVTKCTSCRSVNLEYQNIIYEPPKAEAEEEASSSDLSDAD